MAPEELKANAAIDASMAYAIRRGNEAVRDIVVLLYRYRRPVLTDRPQVLVPRIRVKSLCGAPHKT